MNHSQSTAGWAGLLILASVVIGVIELVLRAVRDANGHGVGALTGLGLVALATIGFTWLVFVFFWVRGTLRSAALRRTHPDADLVDVVVDYGLAGDLTSAQIALALTRTRIWSNTYATVAITSDALRVYGGSIRPVLRFEAPAHLVRAVRAETLEIDTRAVTRHLPGIVVEFNAEAVGRIAHMLPCRTQLTIVRRLTPNQIAETVAAFRIKLGIGDGATPL